MNRILSRFAVICVIAALEGCAGTEMQVQAAYLPDPAAGISYLVSSNVDVPQNALGIFKDRLNSQFCAAALLADDKEQSRIVEIVITNYYMRPGATRALVGIMAGSDNMRSTITIRDGRTKAIVGQFSVESQNPTAMFTSRGLIEDHADQIVGYVKSGGA